MSTGDVLKLIGNAIGVLLFWLVIGWVFYRALKRSYDPGRLIAKWVITGVVIAMAVFILPNTGRFIAVFTLPFALIIAIIWARDIAGIVANPIGNIIDGGNQEAEAKAFYSKAESLRRKSQFNEAIAEVRKQLEKFPNDFTGQMLLAEINAENLQDLQSAEIIIQKIVNQPGHSPAQISGALHALADWHMKLAQDPDSSRVVLEKIIERFPDSSFSQMASQRIAHLGSVDSLLATHERPTIVLKHFAVEISPKKPPETAESLAEDAEKRANDCLRQLEKFPLDTEAREKLATIYAHDYRRVDLAADQLEQLISQPNQPTKQMVRWLNLLADFQIKIGNDVPAAEKTIRRIHELFPKTAHAEQASIRLEYLRLEAKGHQKNQELKLGSYEKDLGLKKSF